MLPRPKMPGGHALTPSPRAARAEERRRRGQGSPGPPHRRAAPGSSSDAGGSCAGCCWSHVHPAVPCSTLCPSPRLHTLPEPLHRIPPGLRVSETPPSFLLERCPCPWARPMPPLHQGFGQRGVGVQGPGAGLAGTPSGQGCPPGNMHKERNAAHREHDAP